MLFRSRRIDVRVANADDRNVEATSFGHGNLFVGEVGHDHQTGEVHHFADAAEHAQQLFAFTVLVEDFLLGEGLESTVGFHGVDLVNLLDGLANGLEVGEHTAQPAVGDGELVAGSGSFQHALTGSGLGADEQHGLAGFGNLGGGLGGFFEEVAGLGQVQNVDAVLFRQDVGFHFRVPALSLVTKVGACSEQVFNRRQICHNVFLSVSSTRNANKPQSTGPTTGAGPMPPKRLSHTGDWFYLGEIAKAEVNLDKKRGQVKPKGCFWDGSAQKNGGILRKNVKNRQISGGPDITEIRGKKMILGR